MKVIWTALARDERAAIIAHIASDNPRAALRMDERFSDAASPRLERHPKIGRPGKVTGTRELIPHESYRLVYEIDGGHRVDPDSDPYLTIVAAVT